MKTIIRRLRGALGNALVWGAFWFGAGFILISGVYLFGPGDQYWSLYFGNALRFATYVGLMGGVAGGAFSAYIATTFRNKGIEDLSPIRLALGGGLISILMTLVVITVVNTVAGSGWPLLLEDLAAPLLIYGAIGSVTGFGSVKLAQGALPEGAKVDELEAGPGSPL